jgi:protease-4
LRDAFEDENTKGVILRANSPGGSPVQSGYIYSEIRRLRELHPDIPLYAVVTDVCASGCYYVASAADEIYVDNASIIGSIGVRMDSFGFVESMEKLGVERRLYTAGESKGFLDPFLPSRPGDVDHVEMLLENIHKQFITAVQEGRGERLQDHPDLFSGLVWTGSEGLEMGLVDAVGSSGYVAREVIGAEEIVDFTQEPDLLERISDRIGVAMVRAMGGVFSGSSATLH